MPRLARVCGGHTLRAPEDAGGVAEHPCGRGRDAAQHRLSRVCARRGELGARGLLNCANVWPGHAAHTACREPNISMDVMLTISPRAPRAHLLLFFFFFLCLRQAGRCRKCGMSQDHENHSEHAGEAVHAQDFASITSGFKAAVHAAGVSAQRAESASSRRLGGISTRTLGERTPPKVGPRYSDSVAARPLLSLPAVLTTATRRADQPTSADPVRAQGGGHFCGRCPGCRPPGGEGRAGRGGGESCGG